MSNVWVGGGCRPMNRTRHVTEVELEAQAKEREARIKEWEEACERRLKAETERFLKTEAWEKACQRICSESPTGIVTPGIGADEAIIHVERFDDAKPMAAYVVFRTTEPEEPNLPQWYLGRERRHGLKGFLTRASRDQVLATHEWLAEEGGHVILKGSVRVVGKAGSGKSLHVELVDGFRLR